MTRQLRSCPRRPNYETAASPGTGAICNSIREDAWVRRKKISEAAANDPDIPMCYPKVHDPRWLDTPEARNRSQLM